MLSPTIVSDKTQFLAFNVVALMYCCTVQHLFMNIVDLVTMLHARIGTCPMCVTIYSNLIPTYIINQLMMLMHICLV